MRLSEHFHAPEANDRVIEEILLNELDKTCYLFPGEPVSIKTYLDIDRTMKYPENFRLAKQYEQFPAMLFCRMIFDNVRCEYAFFKRLNDLALACDTSFSRNTPIEQGFCACCIHENPELPGELKNDRT